MPCRHIEIQTTPSLQHPVLIAAHELILVVKIPEVAETFNTTKDKTPYQTDFTLDYMLDSENVNPINWVLITSLDEPETD